MLIFQDCITNPYLILSVGERTINGRTSTSQTLRATVAVTVTASGKMLKPLVVFKGKPGARIESREFPTYPQDNVYACQSSAWMDERVMRMWVREVLKPYVEDAPVHIQPLLLLDSYKCHTMASVTGDIEALGVQIEIIPGGCTGLCQPVDVGIGKPLKSRARHLWEEWMIDQCNTNNGRSRPPSRLLMSQWISDSVNRLQESDTLVRNSWRHGEYSYFPNEEAVAAAAVDEAADAPDNGAAVERGDEGPLLAAVGKDASDDDSDDSLSSDDDANEHAALPPPLPPALLAHLPQELLVPHQPPHLDPGWDNTDDSNYRPGSSASESYSS
jgi:DDE superfamily endonuclease